MLESVRGTYLQVFRPTWYGGERPRNIRISEIQKMTFPVTAAGMWSNLRAGAKDYFYMELDDVVRRYPKLWYALHCCIPWI